VCRRVITGRNTGPSRREQRHKAPQSESKPAQAGETEHVSASIAHNLIAAGFAELCPLPRRASADWLEARNEQARLAAPLNSVKGDDSVSAGFVVGVEWHIQTTRGRVLILKKHGSTTEPFDENNIPKECPQNVVEQFKAYLRLGPGATAEAVEEARRYQQEYDARIASARRW
jgi:hypothetical protein